jgi:anthranilate synthase/aminodeoxychorismate synthase-like glutamine amidotransferase
MSVLLIDNYDSFTYNLFQYLGELGATTEVVRNDAITPADIDLMAPKHIIISPGPGNPDDAGISKDVIRRFAGKVPILGVCLGHQCIGEVFGGTVERAGEILHGKVSTIEHDGKGVFAGIASPIQATRYHSLAIRPDSVPDVLEVSARSEGGPGRGQGPGIIMGVRHRELPVEGVQFHPESILTPDGHAILRNFLAMTA